MVRSALVAFSDLSAVSRVFPEVREVPSVSTVLLTALWLSKIKLSRGLLPVLGHGSQAAQLSVVNWASNSFRKTRHGLVNSFTLYNLVSEPLPLAIRNTPRGENSSVLTVSRELWSSFDY